MIFALQDLRYAHRANGLTISYPSTTWWRCRVHDVGSRERYRTPHSFISPSPANSTSLLAWACARRSGSPGNSSRARRRSECRPDTCASRWIGKRWSGHLTRVFARSSSRRRHRAVAVHVGVSVRNENGARCPRTPRPMCAGHAHHALVTFSAAGPFAPCTMSNSTASPSASDLKPLP